MFYQPTFYERARKALLLLFLCTVGLLPVRFSVAQEVPSVAFASESDEEEGSQEAAALRADRQDQPYVALGRLAQTPAALRRPVTLQLRDATLEEALKRVSGETGLEFIYGQQVASTGGRVDVDLEAVPAREALREILQGTGLELMLSRSGQLVLVNDEKARGGRKVVPRSVKALPEPEKLAAVRRKMIRGPEAQTGTITGTVTDSLSGEPLPGVNVVIAGTQQGAATGPEGSYAITGIEAGTYALQASFVGYASKTVEGVTVRTDETSTVDIALQPSTVALDEVVAIGYGTQQRRDLTGSVSSIRADDVAQLPVASVEQVLQGRAAGVQVVQNTGAPGSQATVRIRGGNSMQGGNDPLYVIDGFPVSAGGSGGILNMINTNNIESIEILKDASATAIYGARGANGVVMITTKKGQIESQLAFESYYGVQQVPKHIPLMNARQYAEVANEWAQNEGFEVPYPNPDNLSQNTSWQDKIFRTAPLQSYSLAFSGGNERTRYALSGNYRDQEGIILSSDFARGSVRANIESDIFPRLHISNQILLAGTRSNQAPSNIVEHAFIAPPTIPVYDQDGNYYDYSELPWWGAYPRNPIADANEITDRETNFRILENFSAEYTLLDGLTAKVALGADYQDAETNVYATRLHESGGDGGRASVGESKRVVYLNENTLTYSRDFGRDHRLTATGGFTWQHAENSGLSVEGRGFVNDLLGSDVVGSGEEIVPPDRANNDWTLMSWLGRVNYSLKDRYLLTVTGRADGSSRFGAGNKWGVFPSAAFAWRLSEEPFLKNWRPLSDLKLRLSWGRTGNQEIGLYNSLQRIAPISFVDGNTLSTGYAPVSVANPDLRWEETVQYDAGIDLGAWNQRLTLSADAYVKNTSNLLALVNLPSSSGFSTMLRNVGGIRNAGIELSLGFVPVQTESLQWSVDANAAMNRNRVTKLYRGDEFLAPEIALLGSIHLVREGEPLGAFYGFVENSLLDEEGNVTYVDRNEDGIISDLDRVILGSPHPDLTFGLSSSVRYRNLDLSVSLNGVYGNEIYNYALGLSAASFAKGYNQIADVYEDHWTADNPDPNARYPRLETGSYFRPSKRFLENGSYLRLANVRLGYHVPAQVIDWSGANDLMVYASGQNLLTLTEYSWYDPEISNYGGGLRPGVDQFTYPQARAFTIGVRLGM